MKKTQQAIGFDDFSKKIDEIYTAELALSILERFPSLTLEEALKAEAA
ncbi:hypothetical protein VIBNISOn1_1840038 [Vibrio nigripulchritudo SOn1]|uniref:Transposase n=1 Tax=Vibrio nigripulchritudo SOn1 TaxID=1238450 RepID=A0AAV2VQB3_9VIBR|nr:hypothetical protein VIBNISOn1_1840038 [Vibrio nigripulchritudo SOn1]